MKKEKDIIASNAIFGWVAIGHGACFVDSADCDAVHGRGGLAAKRFHYDGDSDFRNQFAVRASRKVC